MNKTSEKDRLNWILNYFVSNSYLDNECPTELFDEK